MDMNYANNNDWNNPFIYLVWLAVLGNGFGGIGGNGCATNEQVQNRFDTQSINNKLDSQAVALQNDLLTITSGQQAAVDVIQRGTYDLNNAILQSSFANERGQCAIVKAVDDCCCQTNLNIERTGNNILSAINQGFCDLRNEHKDEVIRELTNRVNIDETVSRLAELQGRYVMNPAVPYCNGFNGCCN